MELQDAVDKAVAALKEAFSSEDLHDLRLEEIERNDKEEAWYVTLGFDRSVDLSPVLPSTFTKQWRRVYKVVKLNANTGETAFIKIRENTE